MGGVEQCQCVCVWGGGVLYGGVEECQCVRGGGGGLVWGV